MKLNFSIPLLRALTHANTVAFTEYATNGVSVPIFIYSLVGDLDWRERTLFCKLGELGFPLDMIASALRVQIPHGDHSIHADTIVFHDDVKVALDLARIVARCMGEKTVRIDHVILAILQDDEEWGSLLTGFGLTEEILIELMNRGAS